MGQPGKKFRGLLGNKGLDLPSQVLRAEQSNTSILFESQLFLKLYRKLDEGLNPDAEIARFLTERASFKSIPPFAGVLEYHRPGSEAMIIGQLQGFVPNQGDGWTYTLDAVRQYFERVLSVTMEPQEIPQLPSSFLEVSAAVIPPLLQELIGGRLSRDGNDPGQEDRGASSCPCIGAWRSRF